MTRALTATQVRDAFEAAHPAAKRRRENYESMARKVHDFLDVPAMLPVRSPTPAERILMRKQRQLSNLAEHVRWVSLIEDFRSQRVNYIDCNDYRSWEQKWNDAHRAYVDSGPEAAEIAYGIR